MPETPHRPPVRGVLFDLDGTFADTAPDLAAALNHTLATRDRPPLPFETIRPQASHGARGLLQLGFGIAPEHPDFSALRETLLAHYEAHLADHTRLFPGMAETIDTLENRGLPWGIVTNKPHRYTLPLMQALGYAQRAACLISGDTCAHAKPHPESMLHACGILGLPAEQCLYLGDDLRDMQAARAADMPGIIALYGYVSPDASPESWQARAAISHPEALLDFL